MHAQKPLLRCGRVAERSAAPRVSHPTLLLPPVFKLLAPPAPGFPPLHASTDTCLLVFLRSIRLHRTSSTNLPPGLGYSSRSRSSIRSMADDAEVSAGGGRQPQISLVGLFLACMVAGGVQYGWALQLSLLTPYVQVYMRVACLCVNLLFSHIMFVCSSVT